MKKLILIIFLTSGAGSLMAGKKPNPVSVISTHGIVYLKFQKTMMGATLEIRDMQGHIIGEEVIKRKKIIIDFFYKQMGCYQITVKKDQVEETISIDNDQEPEPHHVAHIRNHKHRNKVLVVQ